MSFRCLENTRNTVQSVEQHRLRAAEIDAETAFIIRAAKGCAVVERHTSLVYKFVGQLLVRNTVVGEIEPGKIGSLWQDSLDFGQTVI